MAIPLTIHKLVFKLSLVHLFQSSCLAWHLDKFRQTSDLKLWHSILTTLSYLFKTFSHSVHCQAIGLTGKRHVFCWQWALKWNGNERQLHVYLFARYHKLLDISTPSALISPPYIRLSSPLHPEYTPHPFSLYWNEFAFLCFEAYKSHQIQKVFDQYCYVACFDTFFCPVLSPYPHLKALVKTLTKMYKPRTYDPKFTVLVYSKLSCNGHLNKMDTLFQTKLCPTSS